MLKKWINIVLCVCLLNSITYAQTNNISEDYHSCENADCPTLNSWTDLVIQELIDDGGEATSSKKHIKFNRRYVHSKSHNSTNFFDKKLVYLPYNFAKKVVKKCISTYLIGIALLPAYYNFLFRLSPF